MRITKFTEPCIYIPIIYASLSFPMMALSRNYSSGEESGSVDLRYALAAYLSLAAITAAKIFRGKTSPLPLQSGDQFFVMFLLSIIAQSLLLQDLMIFANASLMLCIAICMRCASKAADFHRNLFFSSVVLLAFLITARIVFGPPEGRWLGGINPNNLSGPALIATLLAMFSSKKAFDLVAAVSMGMALIVSSRYAMLSISFTYLAFWLLNFRHAGRMRIGIILLSCFFLILNSVFSADGGLLGSVLLLNDASRGINSGASGRDLQWAQFIPQLVERPVFGYGFRSRSAYEGAHNGFLNLILENGIPGSSLFLLFFFSRIIYAAKIFFRTPKHTLRGHWLVACFTLIIGAMLQPQLINFGDVFGLSVLMILFSRMTTETTITPPPAATSIISSSK